MTRRDRDRSGPGALMLWLVGGAAIGLGVASLPSIGMLVLPGAVLILGAAGIVTRGRGWPLGLAGAALPLLWVAWLHRRGPGWVTYETDTGGGGCRTAGPGALVAHRPGSAHPGRRAPVLHPLARDAAHEPEGLS